MKCSYMSRPLNVRVRRGLCDYAFGIHVNCGRLWPPKIYVTFSTSSLVIMWIPYSKVHCSYSCNSKQWFVFYSWIFFFFNWQWWPDSTDTILSVFDLYRITTPSALSKVNMEIGPSLLYHLISYTTFKILHAFGFILSSSIYILQRAVEWLFIYV